MSEAAIIIGVDEAGRGALAGPLVVSAAAFLREEEQVTATYRGVRGDVVISAGDSKSYKNDTQREVLDQVIRQIAVTYTVIEKTSKEIDARLMGSVFPEAIKGAIARCIEQIVAKGVYTDPRNFLVMIDGDMVIPKGIPCPVRAVVDGDKRVWQIGAASIIAKVARDARMLELHEKYPDYDFAQNKGYPVPTHKKLLKKHGPCEVHRGTFKPVAEARGPIPGFEF
jgi:ribonuclease HII